METNSATRRKDRKGHKNGTRQPDHWHPQHRYRVVFSQDGTPLGLLHRDDGLYELHGPNKLDFILRRRALSLLRRGPQ